MQRKLLQLGVSIASFLEPKTEWVVRYVNGSFLYHVNKLRAVTQRVLQHQLDLFEQSDLIRLLVIEGEELAFKKQHAFRMTLKNSPDVGAFIVRHNQNVEKKVAKAEFNRLDGKQASDISLKELKTALHNAKTTNDYLSVIHQANYRTLPVSFAPYLIRHIASIKMKSLQLVDPIDREICLLASTKTESEAMTLMEETSRLVAIDDTNDFDAYFIWLQFYMGCMHWLELNDQDSAAFVKQYREKAILVWERARKLLYPAIQAPDVDLLVRYHYLTKRLEPMQFEDFFSDEYEYELRGLTPSRRNTGVKEIQAMEKAVRQGRLDVALPYLRIVRRISLNLLDHEKLSGDIKLYAMLVLLKLKLSVEDSKGSAGLATHLLKEAMRIPCFRTQLSEEHINEVFSYVDQFIKGQIEWVLKQANEEKANTKIQEIIELESFLTHKQNKTLNPERYLKAHHNLLFATKKKHDQNVWFSLDVAIWASIIKNNFTCLNTENIRQLHPKYCFVYMEFCCRLINQLAKLGEDKKISDLLRAAIQLHAKGNEYIKQNQHIKQNQQTAKARQSLFKEYGYIDLFDAANLSALQENLNKFKKGEDAKELLPDVKNMQDVKDSKQPAIDSTQPIAIDGRLENVSASSSSGSSDDKEQANLVSAVERRGRNPAFPSKPNKRVRPKNVSSSSSLSSSPSSAIVSLQDTAPSNPKKSHAENANKKASNLSKENQSSAFNRWKKERADQLAALEKSVFEEYQASKLERESHNAKIKMQQEQKAKQQEDQRRQEEKLRKEQEEQLRQKVREEQLKKEQAEKLTKAHEAALNKEQAEQLKKEQEEKLRKLAEEKIKQEQEAKLKSLLARQDALYMGRYGFLYHLYLKDKNGDCYERKVGATQAMPEHMNEMAKFICDIELNIWFVGGCLRDIIKNKVKPKPDIDLVTGATFTDLLQADAKAYKNRSPYIFREMPELNQLPENRQRDLTFSELTHRASGRKYIITHDPAIKNKGLLANALKRDCTQNSLFALPCKKAKDTYELEYEDPLEMAMDHINQDILHVIDEEMLAFNPIYQLRILLSIAKVKLANESKKEGPETNSFLSYLYYENWFKNFLQSVSIDYIRQSIIDAGERFNRLFVSKLAEASASERDVMMAVMQRTGMLNALPQELRAHFERVYAGVQRNGLFAQTSSLIQLVTASNTPRMTSPRDTSGAVSSSAAAAAAAPSAPSKAPGT